MLKKLSLAVIIFLAALLRLWNLGSVPPSLTWDEAALGYNAYSIINTGRDEYGTFFPLNLKSFGDYKPSVYTYLDIPFVAVLGLNEWAVRLPSALAGIGLVLVIYLLTDELFKKRSLSLLAALSVALSPLSIHFSRAAFESNVALFFNVFATLLFIKGLKNSRYLPFSALLFAFSLFTYQSSRLFVPFLIFVLAFLYRKQVKMATGLLLGLTIGVLAVGVMFFSVFLGGQSNRLAAMNLFAYPRSPQYIQQINDEDKILSQDLTFQILHGEWFAYTRGLFERYLTYFSPKRLFVSAGSDPRQNLPDLGILGYSSLLFLPLGFFFLWKERANSRLILFWLVLAPIPAVFARDLINLLRALNLVLPFAVLEAMGVYYLLNTLSKKRQYLMAGTFFTVVLFFGSLLIFLDRYFIHMPRENSQGWLYGYQQALTFVGGKESLSRYNKVVISDAYGQPYIYYLFYNLYPPRDFQKQAVLDQPSVDVGTVRRIDNIEFRHIYWPTDRNSKNSLFVGPPEELPDKDITPFPEFKILQQVNFLDGQGAFKVVETEKI